MHLKALRKIKAYRNLLARFPAGTPVQFIRNRPGDSLVNIAVVQRNAALSALLVVYLDKDHQPRQQVVAESDIIHFTQEKVGTMEQIKKYALSNEAQLVKDKIVKQAKDLAECIKTAEIDDFDKANIAISCGKTIIDETAVDMFAEQFVARVNTLAGDGSGAAV